MQPSARPRPRAASLSAWSADRQLGLLWGGVAAAAIALSPLAPKLAAALPACPFHALTGLPCPTCGTTRAALLLARFEVVEAVVRFPLAALGWTALLGGGLVAGVAAFLGRGVPEPPRRLPWPVRLGVIGALLANWAYLIATGV